MLTVLRRFEKNANVSPAFFYFFILLNTLIVQYLNDSKKLQLLLKNSDAKFIEIFLKV